MNVWCPDSYCCSVTKLCPTVCDPMDCNMPGFPVLNCLRDSCPLSRWCHPAISSSVTLSSSWPQSFIRIFPRELAHPIRWPKYWSFSFNISPSNEYSGLISFRMDWFDLLAVQGTLKSLLEYCSLKASFLRHSAFLSSNSHICTWLLEKP